MSYNRRDFLVKSFGAAVATAIIPSCFSHNESYLLLGGSHIPEDGRADGNIRRVNPRFGVFDSRSGETEIMDTPCLVHCVVQNPGNKLEFLCLPKLEKTGFIYNHATRTIRTFEADQGMLFYGHGTFGGGGGFIYTAQAEDDQDVNSTEVREYFEGNVSVARTRDFTKVSDLNSYGTDPHDIQPLDNERIVVANGGTDTNICIVNVVTGKLEKKYPCDFEGIYARHILLEGNQIYVLSAMKADSNKGITHLMYPEGDRLVPFGNYEMAEATLKSQLLSAVATDKYIVTTAPKMNSIHIWDKKTRELVSLAEFEEPAGIALSPDKSRYIVTSGFEHDAMIFKASDNGLVGQESNYRKITGRHTTMALI